MALSGGGGGGHVRGRRRPRKRPLSEINVTPLVDVMLVLLIIFMISAPLLNVAVPVELPKTDASAVDASDDPVVISIKRDGAIYVGEREVSFDRLVLTVAEEGGDAGLVVGGRADRGAGAFGEDQHLPALGGRQRHRLLAQHMDALLHQSNADIRMRRWRCADDGRSWP